MNPKKTNSAFAPLQSLPGGLVQGGGGGGGGGVERKIGPTFVSRRLMDGKSSNCIFPQSCYSSFLSALPLF